MQNKKRKKYMRCDDRDNTKKLCGFISIVVPQKKLFWWGRADANQQKRTKNLNLKFDKKGCQCDDNYI